VGESVFEGITVIELGDWVATPYATSLLGDFGADVIKVESPGSLLNSRKLGGFEPTDSERSPFFSVFCRNKRSITLDIRSERGHGLLLELLTRADVMVASFRPGTLESWGLGWEALHELNPSLILLMISAYGQTGPWSARPGFDRVAQAFSGLTYVTGSPDCPPTRAGLGVADFTTGLFGAYGVAMALYERQRSGQGQYIDHSLYESILPMLCEIPVQFQMHGMIRERTGNQYPDIVPGDAFRTSDDRWVQISASGDAPFQRLARAMDRLDIADDERYDSLEHRALWPEELHQIVREWVSSKTVDEVESVLDQADVPACRIMNIADLMAHPQVQARENFVPFTDPVFGVIPAGAPTPRLSRTPGSLRSPGPRIGQDNETIFTGLLGLSKDDLADLVREGVV
jgi:crotonobetainyl-CoA:carnitine CoA-transferase CaiB-like acyl-CoA transferase